VLTPAGVDPVRSNVRMSWHCFDVRSSTWFRPAGTAKPPPDWTPPEQAGGFLVRVIATLVRGAESRSFGNRLSNAWRQAAQGQEHRTAAYRRMRAAQIVDAWITFCLLLEVFFLVYDLPVLRLIGAVLAAIRVLEIAAVWSYAVLFERRDFERRTGLRYDVVAVSRSLIHAVVMIGEVTLCFAIFANALRAHIEMVHTAGDALDYSMRTITTVGVFGAAHGVARYIMDLEPFVGLLFVATVVARLVGGSVQGMDDVHQGQGAMIAPSGSPDASGRTT
jgi:hypothetical protein